MLHDLHQSADFSSEEESLPVPTSVDDDVLAVGTDGRPTLNDVVHSHPGRSCDVSVVVPTRNEAGNVEELVRRVTAVMAGKRVELLFVDDSDDDTPDEVRRVAATAPCPVRLLHRPPGERAGGLGGAVAAGFAGAQGRWIVVMDGDLQHPPEVVPALLEAGMQRHADIVVASRYVSNGDSGGLNGGGRKFVSRAATVATKALFPLRLRRVTDPMSGFFAVRRGAIDVRRLRPHGFKIMLEVLLRGRTLRYTEVPFSFGQRNSGESKASMLEGVRLFRQLAQVRLGQWAGIDESRTHRGLLFGMVGASGIGINMLLLWLLAEEAGLNYVLAAALATQGSTTWNFLLNERFVFRGKKALRGWQRYLAFLTLSNVVLLLRLPLLVFLVSVLGLHYLLGNVLTLLVLFLIRFQTSDRAIYREPRENQIVTRDGPVNVIIDGSKQPRPLQTLRTRTGTGYLPHRYDLAGLMTVASQVRLPELEFFRAPWLGRDLDLEIRVGEVGTGMRWRTVLTRFDRPSGVQYEEHLGQLAANFRIETTDRIDLVVTSLLARSNHVLYTNIIEALLRFVLIQRGFVLLHSACIEMNGHGIMLSARTDTGKTGTILRLLREQDARFLSDDMTIVNTNGHAYCYPKPLTISQHTLRAVDPGDIERLEWLKLRLKSRIHSKEGRGFAMTLAERNLPIMTINAVTQLLVPPPKYAVDRLVPCDVRGDVQVNELFVIERGHAAVSEVSHEEALQELLTNTDDAYGFPPFRYFAPSLTLDGCGYEELRQRERDALDRALHNIRVRRVVCDDFSWADTIPEMLPAHDGDGRPARAVFRPQLNGRPVVTRPRVPLLGESPIPESSA